MVLRREPKAPCMINDPSLHPSQPLLNKHAGEDIMGMPSKTDINDPLRHPGWHPAAVRCNSNAVAIPQLAG